jgi:hypothetical protein
MNAELCLYYLTNNVILFCEEAQTKSHSENGALVYEFPAARTLVIQATQQGKQITLNKNKMSDGMFHPGVIVVPLTSVVMVQDCGEAQLTEMRAALSGLVVAR